MLKNLPRHFKLLYPLAYLTLVFAACVLQMPLAIPFFTFFSPVYAASILVAVAFVAFLAVWKALEPQTFARDAAQVAAILRAQSLWSKVYVGTVGVATLLVLVASGHPFYAAFAFLDLCAWRGAGNLFADL